MADRARRVSPAYAGIDPESDIALALGVINADPVPVNVGKTSHAGNPLLKFEQQIDGVTYKVIGEIRPGKKNRNVAVFNIYKR